MKTALVSLNVSYIHKNLALRWLMVSKPQTEEARIFEGLCKAPLALMKDLLAYEPSVIAFSVYVFNIDATITLIKALKAADPTIKLVAGGPEATHHPEPLWEAGIDGIYRGETELVFWPVLLGKTSEAYQDSPTKRAVILKADLTVLEQLPSPYFLKEDQSDMDKRYLYVETSRGCPYGCTYCMASLDRKVRLFSPSYMTAFFETLKNTGVRQVKFLDRTFNVSKERALDLATQCLLMPDSMSFHVELVGDTLDFSLKEFFITQGKQRFRMEIGVQSLNPKTLNAVGRVSHLPKLLDLIRDFSAHQLKQHVDLIAGLPYEDLSSFKQSYQGLIALAPHEIQVGILKLLHGSQLRQDAEAYGYTAHEEAPYQITKSHWVSQEDIRMVEQVALATEKAYNSQKMKAELDQIFTDPSLVAFDVMSSIGQSIQALSHPYSNQALYLAVFEGLSHHIPAQIAQALLSHAYYKNSTFCPPALFHYQSDRIRLNRLRETLGLTQQVKHLILLDRPDGQAGQSLWTFGSHNTAKACYLLDQDDKIERKVPNETLTGHPQ